jgi:hypothetical protein
MSGVRSVTLDFSVVPECPPGPVTSALSWSWSMCRQATLDRRRLRHGVAPSRFPGGFAGVVVGAAFGWVAQLDDGHDVQGPVDPPVAGAGEPVSLLLSGGRVQGRGAVPGREVVPAGEPVHVARVGQ